MAPAEPPLPAASHPVAIRGIASALATIAGLYRRPVESEDLIEWLRQEKRLLMVDRRPRAVYWDGVLIEYDWDTNRVIWDFLWRTAQYAKDDMPVSEDHLLPPNQRGRKLLVHRRARLSKVLPAQLDDCLESVRPRGYRLVLSRDEIALLQPDSGDELIETGVDVAPSLLHRARS
jgi:hypothetical protein